MDRQVPPRRSTRPRRPCFRAAPRTRANPQHADHERSRPTPPWTSGCCRSGSSTSLVVLLRVGGDLASLICRLRGGGLDISVKGALETPTPEALSRKEDRDDKRHT